MDRFGPRRVMMIGILMAGVALVGLGWTSSLGMFYFFYFFNALGYVCGGPLPNQVLLTGVVRSIARKGDGIRLPRDRHRGSNGPVDIARARPAFRMAGCAADFGPFDRGRLVSPGTPAERTTTSENERWIGHVRESQGSIQASVVLSAYPGEYVLDCRSQWYAAESETFLESRPAFHAAGCRGCPIAGAGFQYRWPVTHGLAC